MCGGSSGAVLDLLKWIFFPQQPFNQESHPTPGNYSLDFSWASHPQLINRAWYVPPNSGQADRQADAAFDVFYVHPTCYFLGYWNAAIESGFAQFFTNIVPMREGAAVFNGVAKVYAPRYRQLSQGAQDPHRYRKEEQDAAMELAYADVKAAFLEFRKQNPGRPFFVGSYSQGTLHAMRLLKEWYPSAPKEERDLVVAAYLIGNTVPEEEMAGILPVCGSASQTRCFISYNSVLAGDEAGAVHWNRKGKPTCVNPLSWKKNEEFVGKSKHLGAIPCTSSWYGEFPFVGRMLFEKPHTKIVSAQCKDGILYASDPQAEHWVQYLFNPGDFLHAFDVTLFFMNLRENIAARAHAYSPGS